MTPWLLLLVPVVGLGVLWLVRRSPDSHTCCEHHPEDQVNLSHSSDDGALQTALLKLTERKDTKP